MAKPWSDKTAKFMLEQDDFALSDLKMEDANGKTLLHYVVESGNTKMMKLLKIKIIEKPWSDETAKFRLEQNDFALSDLEMKDSNGKTLLHYVVESGNTEFANRLLKNEDTLLHLSVKCGDTEAVDHLLKNGAKIDAVNKIGDTPLHLAAKISAMKDINSRTPDGVASNVADPMVEFLINSGAPINIKNKEGTTPRDIISGVQNDTKSLLNNENKLKNRTYFEYFTGGVKSVQQQQVKKKSVMEYLKSSMSSVKLKMSSLPFRKKNNNEGRGV